MLMTLKKKIKSSATLDNGGQFWNLLLQENKANKISEDDLNVFLNSTQWSHTFVCPRFLT